MAAAAWRTSPSAERKPVSRKNKMFVSASAVVVVIVVTKTLTQFRVRILRSVHLKDSYAVRSTVLEVGGHSKCALETCSTFGRFEECIAGTLGPFSVALCFYCCCQKAVLTGSIRVYVAMHASGSGSGNGNITQCVCFFYQTHANCRCSLSLKPIPK